VIPAAARACVLALGLAAAAAHAALDPDAALRTSRAAVGSQPANATFTDASGRRIALADFRGRPLVVSFVYTGCSQVCPTTTRFLARAVREARGVVGKDGFQVASIGFNVPADNPLSMRVFARQQGIDGDPRWALLVPDPAAVEGLARDFGFTYAPQAGGFDHLAQVTILDAEGRIRAQVYGESFELPMLVRPLRELTLGQPVSASSAAQLIERVRLLCTVYDPLTGGYRLDWRLFIELAVGISCLGLTLGYVIRERRRARRA
jgi:protein SCO1/2